MPNTNDPIIVQIVDSVNASLGSSSKEGGKTGGGGGLAGAAGKIAGIFVLVSEITRLVKDAVDGILRPIRSVITGILKLVAQILRPFADMLMMLLIPILQMLKPLIKVFNDTMRPFREAAYKLMKEGIKSGNLSMSAMGIGVLFQGFNMAILAMLAETIKIAYSMIVDMIKNLIINPLLYVFQGVIKFFGGDVDEIRKNIFTQLDSSKIIVNNAIDSVINGIRNTQIESINKLLATFGESVDWKTPEQILAEKMSAMLKAAAKRASANADILTSHISRRGTTYMSEETFMEGYGDLTSGEILRRLKSNYGITN